jgi:tetratricopeptide (TPR) repeat protein
MSDAAPSKGTQRTWLANADALFDLALEPVDHQSLGHYRLLEVVGEGGLGVVWRAEQLEPVSRQVALKLIRPGLQIRRDVTARFQQERRTLARMQHPNIAAIYDAGSSPDGRPYFVMELVEGSTLTDYCWSRGLDLRARLMLFATICDAVQHAHQKGILHRDLKPSNILVTEVDGRPVPKVIDFGIAKVMDPGEDDPDLLTTRPGELPSATYPYMSPEQAMRGEVDVDTRSDIYTLGIILHELLSGVLPMPAQLIRSADFAAIAAHVREVDPPKVSVSARAGGNACDSRLLVGEVDCIIQHATEKEPARRYATAAALADDLRRYLADEPVLARGPGAMYRAKKWVRRHRLAVGVSLLIVTSLATALGVSLVALEEKRKALVAEAEQRQQAEQARDEAQQRTREAAAARAKEAAARTQAEQARVVADVARSRAEDLITDMLFDLRDALEPLGRSALLDQVSRSAERYFDAIPISQDNVSQQRNRAAMHQNRGAILLAQGKAAEAKLPLAESLRLCLALVEREPQSVQRLHDLALAHERAGLAEEQSGDAVAAEKHYSEMLRVFEHLKPSAAGQPAQWREDVCVAHERLGDLAMGRGEWAGAKAHYERGLASLDGLKPTPAVQRRRAVQHQRLGSAAEAEGQFTTAESHYAAEQEIFVALCNAAPADQKLKAHLAIAHGRTLALALREKRVSPDLVKKAESQLQALDELVRLDPAMVSWHRALAAACSHVAGFHELNKDFARAEPLYRRAFSIFRQVSAGSVEQAIAQLHAAACCLPESLEKTKLIKTAQAFLAEELR